MVTIDLSTLPKKLQNRHPSAHSTGHIARLAVGKRYAGRGIRTWLLIDALKKLLNASDVVGFPMIVVDAKEGVGDFYTQFGFKRFRHEPNRLFITVSDVQASFTHH